MKNEKRAIFSQEINDRDELHIILSGNIEEELLGKIISAFSNKLRLEEREYGFIEFNSGNYSIEYLSKNLQYIEIKELTDETLNKKRIKISATPIGIPATWHGHFYVLQNNYLVPLSLSDIEKIRYKAGIKDWTAEICAGASLNDLDKTALEYARKGFLQKFPHLLREIEQWDDWTFLNYSALARKSQLTNAAIILLGKEEATHLIMPANGKITWIVKDEKNIERGYQHFGLPLGLQINSILSKIRNIKYDYSTDTAFAPIETLKYEESVVRELLLNGIAHQNYLAGGSIAIIEKPNELIITNYGSFNEQNLEDLLFADAPELLYRNPHLVKVMINLNIIDGIGSGIKKTFLQNRYKNFPLPDIKNLNANKISVKLYGKILDKNYTEKLITHSNLDLRIVFLLDKVQKREPITEEESKMLRDKKLITGRYPDVFVASRNAVQEKETIKFVREKTYSTDELKELVIQFIKDNKEVSRSEIDDLLIDKYPKNLPTDKKRTKIKNLLFTMSKKDNSITNKGSATKPIWTILR